MCQHCFLISVLNLITLMRKLFLNIPQICTIVNKCERISVDNYTNKMRISFLSTCIHICIPAGQVYNFLTHKLCLSVLRLFSRAVSMVRTGHPSSAPRPLWPNWLCSRLWSPRWHLSWTATRRSSGTWSTWRTPSSRTPSSLPRTTRASWSLR